ncbi:MAG: hypothetical protein AAB610_03105 [Patescibacteria group bacterium]
MKPITSGQKEQCVTVAKDAARKGSEEAVNELEANGVLNSENIQRLVGSRQVAPRIKEFVKALFAELAENIAGCLKLISGAETLELEPTDGKRTIAKAKEVFTWGIDSDFQNWGCNVKADPTTAQNVHVHEMVKDGTFAKIFGGLSENLDELCLTQAQIIQFVQKHKKWLRTEGYATFFLFKVGDEFFVARVFVRDDGTLGAHVRRFSNGLVWRAGSRRRVVAPQLALKN